MLSTQNVVIVIPKRTPDCPEPRAFHENFAQKNTSHTHDEGKRKETDLMDLAFHGESVRGCSSLMRERFVS